MHGISKRNTVFNCIENSIIYLVLYSLSHMIYKTKENIDVHMDTMSLEHRETLK